MDEHLLGVRINDQKAHLQKVLEEVRIANDELSKTFVQIAKAKEQEQDALNKLALVQADIALARDRLAQIEAEAQSRDANSKEIAAQAATDKELAERLISEANLQAGHIVAEAQQRVDGINSQLFQLEAFLEVADGQAARMTNDLGSLEERRITLSQELKDIRTAIEWDKQVHEALQATSRTERDTLIREIEEAKEVLVKTRAETQALFDNLDKREAALKVREQDIAVYQARLNFLIKEQLKKQ